METVASRLSTWLDRLEIDVDVLLETHSSIWRWNQSDGELAVISTTPFGWEELEAPGRQLQRRLLDEFTRWCDLANAVLMGSADSVLQDARTAQEDVREVIDQSSPTYYENVGQARLSVEDKFRQLRRVILPLREAAAGPPLLVPDTNALLYETRLDEWEFDGIPEFHIILLPTVLGELDDLKVNYRRDTVRDKAELLIRQIKGFRSRGRLTEGVTLRSGRSVIRAVAVEPRRERALSWLSWDSADDRILAAVLDIMRQYPGRAVMPVTRDINLQNKAEFAHIPFLEPPDL